MPNIIFHAYTRAMKVAAPFHEYYLVITIENSQSPIFVKAAMEMLKDLFSGPITTFTRNHTLTRKEIEVSPVT